MTTAASYDKSNSRIIATVISVLYIIGIILFVLFFKLVQTWPPDDLQEGGLAVDFGYTEVGLGTVEPEGNTASPQENAANPSASESPDEEVPIVNNTEESVSIIEKPKTKSNPIAAINYPEVKPTTKPSTESSPTVNSNAMFPGKPGGSGNNSEGNKPGEGNMGVPNGSESNIYSGTPTGTGPGGVGIGKGLSGRKLESIPKIIDNSDKTGKIVVKVKVDSKGVVTSAEFSSLGSTLSDPELIAKSVAAAKKAKFTPASDRDFDSGTLIFSYELR